MNFKNIFIQTSIFVLCFVFFSIFIFELPPRLRNKSNKLVKLKTCFELVIRNINFKYNACPNSTFVKDPGPDFPEMKYVKSWTDNFGARKPYSSWEIKENFETQEIFIIGDSFIQAEEIPYEKTIYGIINSFHSPDKPLAYGFGYGSWNPIQYRNAIEMINKKGVLYDIFLFSNDFNPADHRSVYQEELLKNSATSGINSRVLTFISRSLNKSFTYKKIKNFYQTIILNQSKKTKIFWELYEKEINKKNVSCEILDHYSFNAFKSKMQNYIAFSLPSKCWNSIQKESYDKTINELNKSIEIASKLNSEIRLILIPPGWSFKNENTGGRNNFNYTIPDEISFSYWGLRKQLKNQYGLLFYDLEPYFNIAFKEYKLKNCLKKDCKNNFYFSYDGHLNERAHNLLFNYLYKNN